MNYTICKYGIYVSAYSLEVYAYVFFRHTFLPNFLEYSGKVSFVDSGDFYLQISVKHINFKKGPEFTKKKSFVVSYAKVTSKYLM